MKYLLIIFTEFVYLVSSQKNDFKFLPNLPMGEFRLNFKAVLKCDSNSDMQQNYYLSKLSVNETELKGNLTYKIPLDDTLTLKVNMAAKDSIGGWKDNAHVISLPKACSTLKHYMGSEWPVFLKSMGIKDKDSNCPIPPGVYVSKGYNLSKIASGFPKTFFYGTYKTRCYFTDSKNNEYGCVAFVIEIKRPWETE